MVFFFPTCYKISFVLIKVKFISFIFYIQGSFKTIGLLGSCPGPGFCLFGFAGLWSLFRNPVLMGVLCLDFIMMNLHGLPLIKIG